MIQFKRSLYKLDTLYYDYVDDDLRSRNVFRVLTLPDTFKLGKNEFRMLANNEVLVKGSKIYMDIVDSAGNAIYYEVSPTANKDGSRSIIVYIYPDTPPGSCKIIIAGRLGIDPVTKEKIFFNEFIRDEPNVRWSANINVSPYEENDGRIRYTDDPTARYKERTEYLQVLSGSSRLVNAYSSPGDSVYMQSVLAPSTELGSERSGLFRITPVQPKMVGDRGQFEAVDLPYFTGVSTMTSTNFTFSSSMVGGVIEVNGISVPAPNDAVDPTLFTGLSYTASIVRVVSDSQIEVWPPFQRSIKYKNTTGTTSNFSVTSFKNQTNFTASYYSTYPLSSSLTTQSFVEINAYGTEPDAGVLDTINVSYKPVNSFGDFINLGDYRITSRNLLTDSASIAFLPSEGVMERSIGSFDTVQDFYRYWESGSVGNIASIIYDNSTLPIKVSNGVLIKTNASASSDRYIYFRPKDIYSVYVDKNTECVLSLSSFLESHAIGGDESQIDIYISGSGNVYSQQTTDRLYYQPIKSAALGQHIGSITAENGVLRDDKIHFYVRESGNIRPVLVLRRGHWHVGNIEMKPRQSLGFSPNQCRLFVPLTDVERETELIIRLQYNDRYGIRSDRETMLYGLYFSGSSPIQFSEIPNVPANIGGTYSISSSYHRMMYFTASIGNINNNIGSILNVKFPIFQHHNTGDLYTGSNYNVGMMFSINTTIHARTGSAFFPENTYVWGGTVQGRAVISPSENGGLPSLYNVVAMSGSSYNQIGTFGNGHPTKTNLDSWFTTLSVLYDSAGSPDLLVRYRVLTTSSFAWSASVVSTCEVWKYEQKLTE